MMFSVTERGNFQRCERMWRLTSKNGHHLGPIVSPVYLNTGTLIHKGSQEWLLDATRPPSSRKSYAAHVVDAATKMIVTAEERYLHQVHVTMSSEERQTLWDAAYFARVMAENYETRWGSPLPEGFTLVRPEQRAQVPVPGTEHQCGWCGGVGRLGRDGIDCPECHETGVELHYLDMRFDGIIQDRAGRLHVLEHKTFKNHPSPVALQNNDQFLAYMWGARQLGIGPVVGLSYDGLWRRDKIPKGKTFEDLFVRYEHTRSEAEFAEFGRLLPYVLNEMYAKRPAVRHIETLPFNRRWQGCFDCPFDNAKDGKPGVCSAMSRAEVQLVDILLRTKFTERTDDIDDDAPDPE